MKQTNKKKLAKPSEKELMRVFELYSCGPVLAGYAEPPLSFVNDVCRWFLKNLERLQRIGNKSHVLIEQVLIAYPTDPGAWGSKLLKKAFGKKPLGPLYFMDCEGNRRCEAFTEEHAQKRHQRFIIMGEVASLDAKLIARDGKARSLGDVVGLRDSTQSSLAPGNIIVFGRLDRTRK